MYEVIGACGIYRVLYLAKDDPYGTWNTVFLGTEEECHEYIRLRVKNYLGSM